MNPKKVLILNYGLHISGVSRALVNLANALVEHGYDVTVKIEVNDFTLRTELDPRVKCSLFLREPHPFGLRIRGFLRFYDRWMKRVFRLSAERQYKAVVRGKYDIEIAFNRGAAARIVAASVNKRAVKLAWVHNDYMQNDNPLAGFSDENEAARAYQMFDRVVCVSKQAEDSFIQKFGNTRNTVTKYNLIDTGRVLSLSREEQPAKSDCFSVAACGRLHPQKNYPLLLQAMSLLQWRGLSVKCHIIGDGEEREQLLALRNELCLSNVTFHGAQNNPYPYLAAADLYVSSSVYEGLSTTTIEALILGKPCVVTDCAGMKEILGENNEYGIITPISAEALADAVEKMAKDESLRRHYAEQARIRAADFDKEKLFHDIEELFCVEEK